MCTEIIRVDAGNYAKFDDMVFWRRTGTQRQPSSDDAAPEIVQALENPNLFLYAMQTDGIFVGWISLIYLPKVGKFQGHGHIYVDELWVAPPYRRRGYAEALMRKADELAQKMSAAGMRLYVNVDNPAARKLYEKSGYSCTGTAQFMEKDC